MLKRIPWGDIARIACVIAGTLLGIQFCPPPAPPPTPPPGVPPTPPTFPVPPMPPPAPKPDTLAAIVRMSAPGVGCSGTIIGERRADGRYDVLSAAHCAKEKGQRWTLLLRDGRRLGATVVNLDRRADWCWLVTDTNTETLPFALLADATPAPGTKLWHAGFGVDKPGNREDGELLAGPNSDGQISWQMSVSSGDSGGGVVIDSDGRVVSCVCCTTRRGGSGQVWGASPEAIRRGRGVEFLSDEWTPLEIPLRMPDHRD